MIREPLPQWIYRRAITSTLATFYFMITYVAACGYAAHPSGFRLVILVLAAAWTLLCTVFICGDGERSKIDLFSFVGIVSLLFNLGTTLLWFGAAVAVALYVVPAWRAH